MNRDARKKLRDILAEYMAETGYNQTDLADRTGVGRRYIMELMRLGVEKVDTEDFARLAHQMGLTVSKLAIKCVLE